MPSGIASQMGLEPDPTSNEWTVVLKLTEEYCTGWVDTFHTWASQSLAGVPMGAHADGLPQLSATKLLFQVCGTWPRVGIAVIDQHTIAMNEKNLSTLMSGNLPARVTRRLG